MGASGLRRGGRRRRGLRLAADRQRARADGGRRSIVDQLRVIEPTRHSAIVRPAWNDPVILKRVLDTGAADAARARTCRLPRKPGARWRAARYPPEGRAAWQPQSRQPVRPVGGLPRAGQRRDLRPGAARNGRGRGGSRRSRAVEGVDGLFIGPSDLAASLGHRATTRIRAYAPSSPTPAVAPMHRHAHRDPRPCRGRRSPVSGDGLHLRRGGQRHRRAAQRDRCVTCEVSLDGVCPS